MAPFFYGIRMSLNQAGPLYNCQLGLFNPVGVGGSSLPHSPGFTRGYEFSTPFGVVSIPVGNWFLLPDLNNDIPAFSMINTFSQ